MRRAALLYLTLALALPLAAMADGDSCKRMNLDKRFNDMDTNHDGTISRAEFHAMMDKQFDEMDANHDGTLTKQEMLDYRHLMMKEKGTQQQ